MPQVRGRRKAGAAPASKTVKTSKTVKKTQQQQDIRKSLSVLQPAADNPTSLVGCGSNSTPQKVKKLKPLLDAKENSPVKPRRSKRKVAVLNCEEHKVKSSTPVSNDEKNAKISSVKQQTLIQCSEKLIGKLKENDLVSQQDDQKEILEHSKASLSSISIPSESSGYYSDGTEGGRKSDVSVEGQSTANSADTNESLARKDDCIPPSTAVQNAPSNPQDVYDMLVSDKAPLYYWRELAEQRRLALEEALRENESLHDQVEVMQTENARLSSLVNDAEKLAEVVKNILGDS